MEASGSGHRPYGIVSGKGYSSSSNNGGGEPAGSVNRGSQSGSEAKRKKRIAKYKVYAVEGKVKSSLKKGFRWIKNKCSHIVHGY